jgi:hypothetical protein
VTSVEVELGLTALAAMLSPTTLTVSVLALVLGDRPIRTGKDLGGGHRRARGGCAAAQRNRCAHQLVSQSASTASVALASYGHLHGPLGR